MIWSIDQKRIDDMPPKNWMLNPWKSYDESKIDFDDDEEKKYVFPALYIIMTLRIIYNYYTSVWLIWYVCPVRATVYESDKNT